MSIQFFQTRMGQLFFEVTAPSIARQLERLNNNLERLLKHLDAAGGDKPVEMPLHEDERLVP